MGAILVAIVLATMAASAGAAQTPVISCRAIGMTAEQGETMCVRTNLGPRMARCGMVLNVSSWTFLAERCELQPASEPPAEAGPAAPSP